MQLQFSARNGCDYEVMKQRLFDFDLTFSKLQVASIERGSREY